MTYISGDPIYVVLTRKIMGASSYTEKVEVLDYSPDESQLAPNQSVWMVTEFNMEAGAECVRPEPPEKCGLNGCILPPHIFGNHLDSGGKKF